MAPASIFTTPSRPPADTLSGSRVPTLSSAMACGSQRAGRIPSRKCADDPAGVDRDGVRPGSGRVFVNQGGPVDPVEGQGSRRTGMRGTRGAPRGDGEPQHGTLPVGRHFQFRFQPDPGDGGDRQGEAHFRVVPAQHAIGVGGGHRRCGPGCLGFGQLQCHRGFHVRSCGERSAVGGVQWCGQDLRLARRQFDSAGCRRPFDGAGEQRAGRTGAEHGHGAGGGVCQLDGDDPAAVVVAQLVDLGGDRYVGSGRTCRCRGRRGRFAGNRRARAAGHRRGDGRRGRRSDERPEESGSAGRTSERGDSELGVTAHGVSVFPARGPRVRRRAGVFG